MKLEILAECVTRLAECDVDNPADQKTISVCENYILKSYDAYLENCEVNDIEPLTKTEYMQNLLLNEGFFKKLMGGLAAGAAVAGTAVAAKKAYNAGNAYATANGGQTGIKNMGTNLKNMAQASGGTMGAIKNVAGISLSQNKANNQMANATKTTTYADQNGVTNKTQSMQLGSKQAGENGPEGKEVIKRVNAKGKTYEVDANSDKGKRLATAAENRIARQNNNETNANNQNQNQQQNAQTNNTQQQNAQTNNTQQQNAQTNNTQQQNPPANDNNQNQQQNQQKQGIFKRAKNAISNVGKKVKGFFMDKKNKKQNNNQNPQQNVQEQQPVNESLENIMLLDKNSILNLFESYNIEGIEEDIAFLRNDFITESMFKDLLNEELGSTFEASKLNEPLTPSIRIGANFKW